MRSVSKTRRQRQLQIRFRLTIGIIACIALFIIIFSKNTITSNANKRASSIKMFTSIEIQGGDTLYSIANKYADEHYSSANEYVREVIRINSLDNANDIVAGQYLVIPYYKDYACTEQ